MIQALIQNKEQTAVIELPQDVIDLQIQLHQIGIRKKADALPIADDEERNISIKLFADSDIGNHLALLFTENDTLADANRCVHKVKNAPSDLLDDIEQNLLYDQYTSPQELIADIGEMTEKLVDVTVDYYCPLKFQMAYPDYNDLEEISNGEAQEYTGEIQGIVQREQEKDLNDMAFYFDGSEAAKAKIVSAVWDVESVNGELYGVIHTKLRSAFTSAEEAEWISELVGQAADGFGEGVEQREIRTDEGDLYVSFWNDGDDYFMENETDFEQRFESPKMNGMEMN